jgi:hypothetical protein
VVDTLRAAPLSCYGCAVHETPHVDGFRIPKDSNEVVAIMRRHGLEWPPPRRAEPREAAM